MISKEKDLQWNIIWIPENLDLKKLTVSAEHELHKLSL